MTEREIVSSLDLGAKYQHNRRVGNTERLVNEIIEAMFDGKKVLVKDHYMDGSDRNANDFLMDRIIHRFEHIYPSDLKRVKIDRKGYNDKYVFLSDLNE